MKPPRARPPPKQFASEFGLQERSTRSAHTRSRKPSPHRLVKSWLETTSSEKKFGPWPFQTRCSSGTKRLSCSFLWSAGPLKCRGAHPSRHNSHSQIKVPSHDDGAAILPLPTNHASYYHQIVGCDGRLARLAPAGPPMHFVGGNDCITAAHQTPKLRGLGCSHPSI